MMLPLIAMMAFLVQANDERAPRPTDDALVATIQATDPSVEILDRSARDGRNGSRIICGTARIKGHVEPFTVMTSWKRSSLLSGVIVNSATGQPARPAEPDHWTIASGLPSWRDEDGDGIQSRTERNTDALTRKLAVAPCPELTPPDGVTWVTELEPDPDPAREAEAQRRARESTDLIFGAAPASARPNP